MASEDSTIKNRSASNDKVLTKDIVDAYGFGNVVIFELGVVPLIFLILFIISSLAAISLGLYSLSEWSKGSNYENSEIKKNNYDVWSYIVSGLALILAAIFFIMLLVFYFQRKKRFDQKLLRDKSDQMRAAILTRSYRNDLNETLPEHSSRVLNLLKTGAKLTADNILINSTGGAKSYGDEARAASSPTSVESTGSVPSSDLPERAGSSQESVGSQGSVPSPGLAKEAAQIRDNPTLVRAGATGIEGGSNKLGSPVSLSRSYKRHKSPSSLKKKKKPSPKKKKSTSSRRK